MMDPTNHESTEPAFPGDRADLRGRPSISIETFRNVAVEVATTLGVPIAICQREARDPGVAAIPFVNKPLAQAERDGRMIIEVVHPEASGSEATAEAKLLRGDALEALANTPGGAELDRYFGVSSGVPEQPPGEAARSDELIKRLREVSSTGGDLRKLLNQIADHSDNSGVDPDALRALRRGRGKQPAARLPSDPADDAGEV